jgi:hypothetical protein
MRQRAGLQVQTDEWWSESEMSTRTATANDVAPERETSSVDHMALEDAALDNALCDTFPASDPIALCCRSGASRRNKRK